MNLTKARCFIAIPMLLWVAFFFLPVLERTDSTPGYATYGLVGWPVMWPFLLVHTLSHLLFLLAVVLSGFGRWLSAIAMCLAVATLTYFFPAGPYYYTGSLALWGAYFSLIAISLTMTCIESRQNFRLLP